MSNKGIYTALSGAMAQNQRLDTIANNLANVNTTAFKKDKQVFNEYLTANEKGTDVLKVPKVPANIESFYDMQGADKSYVDSSGSYTKFTQGILKPTGNTMDIALEGKGFLEVLSPAGPRYTRNGGLKINQEGVLVTRDGQAVLSEGAGQDAQQRLIRVGSHNVTVSFTGDVYEGGELKGKLSLLKFQNPDVLQKEGSSLYKVKNNFRDQPQVATDIKIHQGFLEASNVNVVEEMTNMITATRTFQSTQEAIKAFDSMNDKLVNVVPKAN